jgi:serpin B
MFTGRRCPILILALALLAAPGCRKPTTSPPPDPNEPKLSNADQDWTKPSMSPAQPCVTSVSAFGFKLLRELTGQAPDRNVFISPAGLALALTLTWNGARGETQAAMGRTLELPHEDAAVINQDLHALQQSLTLPSGQPELNIANSVWAHLGIPLAPYFERMNQMYFQAQLFTRDLHDAGAAPAINAWIGRETRGKITNAVAPEDLQRPDPIFVVLVNAVYFHGLWHEPFDRAATMDERFRAPHRKRLKVPMMSQQGTYFYAVDGEMQAVSLPYADGRFSMHIWLPRRTNGVWRVAEELNAQDWEGWIGSMRERPGTIKLPRFEIEYGEQLKPALTNLGMGIAFDAERADFTDLSPSPLWLDEVKHKSYVQVNEQGTEAAAATVVGAAGCAPPPPPPGGPFTMIVDHPFLCAIRDNATGVLLFLGIIADPTQAVAVL